MSCGRICKTNPCTFPHCCTGEARESFQEGYEAAQHEEAQQRIQYRQSLEAARQNYQIGTERHDNAYPEGDLRDAPLPRSIAESDYLGGYSDGYDEGLRAAGDNVPLWIPAGVWLGGVLVGVAIAWAVM
jgi:hypothetical protein